MAPRARKKGGGKGKEKKGGADVAVAQEKAAAVRRRAAKLQQIAFIWAAIFLTIMTVDYYARYPDLTIPRVHRVAKCSASDEHHSRHFLMCSGAATHNTALLNEFLSRAKSGLLGNDDAELWKDKAASQTLSTVMVEHYTAFAMRSAELFTINKVVHDFLMHSFKFLACTRLVDISDTVDDGSFRFPPFLCTEAVFAVKPTGDLRGYEPTELMLTVQRMALLFCLFGSEYHEGTVAYLMVLPFDDKHLIRPTFGAYATSTYLAKDPKDSWFELMTMMWKSTKYEKAILGPIMEKLVDNFNVMAAKEPNGKATWNETFFESVSGYNTHSYWKATRYWYEQVWDGVKAKMRRVIDSVLLNSIKYSFYVTSVMWLSAYHQGDHLSLYSLRMTLFWFPMSVFAIHVIPIFFFLRYPDYIMNFFS